MEEDGRLIVGRVTTPRDGYISFYYLGINSMPPDVTFENSGNLQLGDLKKIPEGVFFDNEGYIYWSDVNRGKISRGTRFGKWVKGIVTNKGVLDFGIPEINEGDLLTATFKYL
jgi:sugar lactone lactonase YvrE